MRRILREQRSAPMALSSRGGSPNVVQGPRIGIGLGAGSPQSQSASERAIGLAVRGPRPVGVRHGRGRSTSSLHPYVSVILFALPELVPLGVSCQFSAEYLVIQRL